MNYNYLRYFSVLAQVEHYTLAAARLEISQPSLSSAIHHLEDELGGVKLFEKAGRNVRLTEEGRFFKEQVDAALNQLQSATVTLKESKISAPVQLRMGVVSGALGGTVAKEIAAYVAKNSRVRFIITESAAADLMDMVRQERLDIALVDTTHRDRSLHFRKLYQQDLTVALPKNHPLANEAVLYPALLTGYPQITVDNEKERTFGQWASGAPVLENIVCTVNTAQAALELVSAGAGFCLLSSSCITPREDVVFVPLQNLHQALYMCILYDKWLEPLIWDFAEGLVHTLRKHSN